MVPEEVPVLRLQLARLAGTTEAPPEARYVDALIADLEASLPFVWGRRVHTVFIGGGTPSLFAPASIERLIAAIRARLPLEPGCEITLEANPGTFERERFHAYAAAGVTRLSIGVQSFDDAQAGRARPRPRCGPGARRGRRGAGRVRDLQPRPDVRLAGPDAGRVRGRRRRRARLRAAAPLALSPDDRAQHLLRALPAEAARRRSRRGDARPHRRARASGAGLERYEVSAFARPGHRARHNLNYWEFGDYLGIGAGAHGKLSFPHRIARQVRLRDPAAYMAGAEAGAAVASEVEVARADLPFEFMLNALRLKEGFEIARFGERTGLPLSAIERPLAEAERRGLVERDLQRVQPTRARLRLPERPAGAVPSARRAEAVAATRAQSLRRHAAARAFDAFARPASHRSVPTAQHPLLDCLEAPPRFVPSKIDPTFNDRAALSLDGALQLLQQSGHALPDRKSRQGDAWLQAVIDGLCQLSSRDPLTGLANRRHFELTLAGEVDRVARAGEPALVLMIDIDHFKRVNDAHGHQAGDLVLKAVAARSANASGRWTRWRASAAKSSR